MRSLGYIRVRDCAGEGAGITRLDRWPCNIALPPQRGQSGKVTQMNAIMAPCFQCPLIFSHVLLNHYFNFLLPNGRSGRL
jgi:hypothetical protein